ncbi:G patch domain-containing protein 1-like [Scylla paramamosain]|uniref:G patch domain-containing protein 1-like n=1 Tax=Scylla paramamosain TaxID=85552 RepID=UPI003082C721
MDEDEDDVVCIGTPLEELSEDDVQVRKALRLEDQIVTDKQGRRRFHGAFTGGFSAGYFNSVGTKEGWTPSAFVSSKGQRSEAKQSRPQDFMDDEDLEAFGIAPQGIRASADFDGRQQGKRKRVNDPSGPIPGTPVLEELLRPTRETMGMKLLRRLGWRPGQGVGPRVSRRQKVSAQREKRRLLASQRAGQRAGSSEGSSEDSEDEALQDVTYAPTDVPELSAVQPKVDQFGLGYVPLSRTPVLGGHVNLFDPAPLSLTEKKKKLLIKGQAFGVGAFEEDDEDIYATEDMSNYDFGEEKDSKGRGQGTASHNTAVLGLVKAIEGFKLSSQPLQQHKVYPSPAIPPGFTPHHKPRRRRFERKESELRGLGRHSMTAEHRAHIIADKPKATVEIRSGVKGQQQQPAVGPKESSKPIDTSEVDKIYEEFKNSDKKLGSDFKPFASVPEKQKRYELFLRMKEKGQKDRFYLAQPKSMTEWERERELQEFSRAAKLFQPLVSSMATRFVTAATTEADPTLKDGLNVNVPKAETKAGEKGLLDPVEPGDERTAAARAGMYGKLTQSVQEWHPDSLLCRRFNVPNPYPDSHFVGVHKTRKEKLSMFGGFHSTTEETAGLRTSSRREEESKQGQEEQEQNEEVEEGGEQFDDKPEDYGLKVPVDGPPTMDLFKAIFQDSDSDSDSDSEKESTSPKRAKEDHHSHTGGSSHPIASSEPQPMRHEGERPMEENAGNEQTSTTTTSTTTSTTTTSRRAGRVSRFEPLREDTASQYKEPEEPAKPTNQPDDIAKLTFIPRKKDPLSSKPVSVAEGIFANVDFVALNSYRNQRPAEVNEDKDKEAKQTTRAWPEAVIKAAQDKAKIDDSSSSSTDSEDMYGPPAPSHLKNRAQEIQSTPPVTRFTPAADEAARKPQGPSWVVKEGEKSKSSTKKHKHKSKSKSKKEKKKKKDKKSKRHKEKKKKAHRSSSRKRKSSSSSTSSSRSDSSSSDSD